MTVNPQGNAFPHSSRRADDFGELVSGPVGVCCCTFAGPPGTGKTAVAASIVREWLSACTFHSGTRCEDAQCACRAPIFVAAGTHAALRSLKNKLDQEGTPQRICTLGLLLQLLWILHSKDSTPRAAVHPARPQ